MDVGIDLGTATVIVYIGGEGVVLSEPSVIAVNLKTDSVISVGQEAYEMIGKTPSHIQAIRPLSKGVVCNYKMTEEMVKHFIKKICKDSLIKPRIAMCVPSGITNVESNAVIDVAIASGARKVYLIEEPVAAAIGAQIDIEKPNGNLIVDIGGGTTDIAVLSLNGIVNKKSIKIAGDTINDAIVRYVRNSHGVLIGEKMADQIKRQVASVCWEEGEDISAPVKGRNLTTGLPCNIEISRSMLYDCVIKEVEQIITAVKEVIERTPPELVGDIHTNGITLTGGGSLLHGIAPLLEKHTRIHTVIAEDPVNCVAIGTGKSFQYLDKLVDGCVIPAMQRGEPCRIFTIRWSSWLPTFLCASPETTALAPMPFCCPILQRCAARTLPATWAPAAASSRCCGSATGSRDRRWHMGWTFSRWLLSSCALPSSNRI